ncbi:hypothetical protein AVEN_82351-1 [Araneus ventricosus]|uniref:Transposon Ty3-I Gag-Pol polyprotein n=1 Tax=Araneus ventricosus TaxID=182803 RepID=A0A4Y2IUX2_ARAVE|nr:hypothetical protein AVEN_82351-1 [Araneus ventricosus]
MVDIFAHPQEDSEAQHLTPILENLETLNEEQRRAVRKLLKEFQNLFSTCDGDVGRCIMTQIELTQKDVSTQFCVDYRKLNEITKKDSYPLQRIDETLDALNGSQWFTTLDLKNGYWQVEVRPEDREKIAFTTGQGHWQFKALISSPILTYPRIDKDFILDMDVSNEGIGAVLSKNIGNVEHVIAYFRKSLDPWSSCEIQKVQLEYPAIKPILKKKLNSAHRPSWQEIAKESPVTKRYWALWDSLHLKDSVLYRRWESDDGSPCRWQVILPKSRIPEVCERLMTVEVEDILES